MASSVSSATIPSLCSTEPELQTLLAEITGDLFQSPTYRDVMHLLAVTPDRDANTSQRVAQTIARHAIRMTLKHLCQRPSAMPSAMPSTASRTSSSQRRRPPLPLPPRPKARSATPPPPTTATGNTNQLSTRQQTYLQALGRQLRARRQSCRFSLAQLHHLTKIPLQHLQAFESSQLDLLPTNPSYIWGMIRIWGNVLGMDGFRLATGIPDGLTSELPIVSELPTSTQPISVTPMTSDKKTDKKADKTTANPEPLSRYLAYGTVAAGTLVGMGLIIEAIEPANHTLDETPAPPSAQELKQQASIQRAILPSDIAPPEGIRRHLRRD